MQTTVKLTQEDIKIIILDFYKRQGDNKESVQFYEKIKENEDESEIYAIVSEKEKDLTKNQMILTPDIKKSDNLCTKCRCLVFGYSGPNLNNPG
jgi:hypothetical protein